jgi:high-affinity K+ transport system ATPase subunit B
LPATLFVGALIPIIFHKKIPKLKNFTSIKARVLFALLYLAIPVTVGGFISAKSEA